VSLVSICRTLTARYSRLAAGCRPRSSPRLLSTFIYKRFGGTSAQFYSRRPSPRAEFAQWWSGEGGDLNFELEEQTPRIIGQNCATNRRTWQARAIKFLINLTARRLSRLFDRRDARRDSSPFFSVSKLEDGHPRSILDVEEAADRGGPRVERTRVIPFGVITVEPRPSTKIRGVQLKVPPTRIPST